jgi:hypothetical protein
VTETTTTAPATAEHVLASDPLLRWEAIAAHARDHHHHTWPSDDNAISEITGAFDSIIPDHCAYDPGQGTITSPALTAPPSWAPKWTDPQLLNCLIATFAATAPYCDLQHIYDEATYVAGPRPT